MAKRVAGKRQGLLYGLIATIVVAIVFAVLFFVEKSSKQEMLQVLSPGTMTPEAVQADMSRMQSQLADAGITARSTALKDQFNALLEMNERYKQAVGELSYRIDQKSPGPDARGLELMNFVKNQLVEADTARAVAKRALEITPKLPDVSGAQVVDPTSLAAAISHLEGHIKALEESYKARQLDIQKAAQNNESLQSTIDTNLRNAEQKFNDMVTAKDAEIAAARVKIEEVQTLSDAIEREREAVKTSFNNHRVAAAEQLQQRVNRQIELESQIRELLDKVKRETTGVAQPDGKIVSLMPGEKTGYIDLAAGDGVFTNLTFAVYDPSEIVVGKEKGYVKIVNVMDNASEVVITTSRKTDPIVKGDVITNIVYDRTRRFHFAVIGRFDINGDGKDDSDLVKHMIRNFGGKIDDKLNVRTDYLVVGEAPMSSFGGATGQQIVSDQEIRDQQKIYGEATDLAQRFWIPVLNQNRLLTLLGVRPMDEAVNGD
jgi:hypothetical protein